MPKKTDAGSNKPAAASSAKKRAAATGERAKLERVAYKVSPLRGMAVSDYIASRLSGWQAEAAERLVAMVARAAPTSTVSIKWSMPVFEDNGPIAFIKPAKAHLSFGFWRGAELTDAKGLLEAGDRMGHVKFRSLEEVDVKALEPMVRQAAKLNHEKGSPTIRSK